MENENKKKHIVAMQHNQKKYIIELDVRQSKPIVVTMNGNRIAQFSPTQHSSAYTFGEIAQTICDYCGQFEDAFKFYDFFVDAITYKKEKITIVGISFDSYRIEVLRVGINAHSKVNLGIDACVKTLKSLPIHQFMKVDRVEKPSESEEEEIYHYPPILVESESKPKEVIKAADIIKEMEENLFKLNEHDNGTGLPFIARPDGPSGDVPPLPDDEMSPMDLAAEPLNPVNVPKGWGNEPT